MISSGFIPVGMIQPATKDVNTEVNSYEESAA
jgi:hypothetical protein